MKTILTMVDNRKYVITQEEDGVLVVREFGQGITTRFKKGDIGYSFWHGRYYYGGYEI